MGQSCAVDVEFVKNLCIIPCFLFDKIRQVGYNGHINRIFANISTDLGPVSFYRIAVRCDYWMQSLSLRFVAAWRLFLLATGKRFSVDLFFVFR